MAFDPYLYVAFAAGLIAGRCVRAPEPWTGRATLAVVIVLVALLGATLAAVDTTALIGALPVSFAFAALLIGLTAAAAGLLSRSVRAPGHAEPRPGPPERVPLPVVLLAALLVGYGVGHVVTFPYSTALRGSLYALLAVVAFGLRLSLPALRRAWVPVTASVAGGIAAAIAMIGLVRVPWTAAFGTALAFGWYTLAGPLVAERWGPALGLVAFVTNYLREDLTMLLAPVLGRRLRGEGVAAIGGATAMDTTLYFAVRYGDRDAGALAFASGLVLTVAASLLLPALLAL